MEPSISHGYQQLPEAVKKVVRLHSNAAISVNTNKAIIIRLLALFLSALCVFTLCLALFSGELFYRVVFIVLLVGVVLLFSHGNRIVIDAQQGTIVRQQRWLWRSARVLQQQELEQTDVIMTRVPNQGGRRIKLLGQVLQFEQASDAEALMALLKQHANANTLEQISHWPNKTPWSPASDTGLHPDHPASADAEWPISEEIVPLWSLRDKLKLLIPALVFSFITAALPWVRSL